VRTMFDNNNNNNYYNNDPILRLDRYLPDSSDSTLDLKKRRNKKLVNQGKYMLASSLFLLMGLSLISWCNVQLAKKTLFWCTFFIFVLMHSLFLAKKNELCFNNNVYK